jgi:transcriptional regulator with XRE-family HTH domain
MTLKDLAAKSGVSYSYLKYIEGSNRQPTGVVAHKIAFGLSCDVEDFTTPTEPTALAS